jgi:hypothetical protein
MLQRFTGNTLILTGDFELGLLNNIGSVKNLGTLGDGLNKF